MNMNNPFKVQDSTIRIFTGDCVEGMRKHLADGEVDVIVTSPPYNIGVKYSTYDDTISREKYLAWTDEWANEVKRVLNDNGSFFLNIGCAPSDPWVPFDVAAVMRKRFTLQNTIHWIKSISVEKKDVGANYGALIADASFGHFKPINSRRFVNDCHEFFFHFTKTGAVELDRLAVGVPYQDKSNVARWKSAGRDRRCRGNCWFVPYKTILSRDKQRPHPATFPVELARKAIALHGARPGLLVCDPFLGLGHAAVAAVECGADFVGFEIDESYAAQARDAVRAKTPEPSLFDGLFPPGPD